MVLIGNITDILSTDFGGCTIIRLTAIYRRRTERALWNYEWNPFRAGCTWSAARICCRCCAAMPCPFPTAATRAGAVCAGARSSKGKCCSRGMSFATQQSTSSTKARCERNLEIHVALIPGGRASSYVANALRAGDSVRLSGPFGTSFLRRSERGGMLCVGVGTGLAPVLSIVREALLAGMQKHHSRLFRRALERRTLRCGRRQGSCHAISERPGEHRRAWRPPRGRRANGTGDRDNRRGPSRPFRVAGIFLRRPVGGRSNHHTRKTAGHALGSHALRSLLPKRNLITSNLTCAHRRRLVAVQRAALRMPIALLMFSGPAPRFGSVRCASAKHRTDQLHLQS